MSPFLCQMAELDLFLTRLCMTLLGVAEAEEKPKELTTDDRAGAIAAVAVTRKEHSRRPE